MKNLNVVILAAGRGSRLNKLTQYKPKTLVKLNGKFHGAIIKTTPLGSF